MAIRKILVVLALALLLLAVSQLVFTSWWLGRMPDIVDSPSFYLWGLPGILFGVILLIAVLERAIGLRGFMAAVAVISMAVGGLLLANPEPVRDTAVRLVLDQPHRVRVFEIWVSGILRAAIAITILYALLRPPVARRAVEAPEPVQPPNEPDVEQ